MIIRKAISSDAKEYLSFLHKLDSQTSFMLFEPGERKSSEEEIKRRIEDSMKNSLLLVAQNEGKIVGFLSAGRGTVNRIKHSAYVVTGILEDYRGKGIGRKLFEELDKWAVENELIRLELTVMVPNEGAVALYKKMGYKIEGIKEKSCLVDGAFIDEYYMAKIVI